jgi:four helix bundle protein
MGVRQTQDTLVLEEKANIILDKTFAFAVNIALLNKKLKQEREFQIGNQLFRSAGSIGANVEEAPAAQSPRDFLSKMSIASKEARETRFWLKVIDKASLIEVDLSEYLRDIEDIINIITKIVKTSSQKLT